MSATPPLRLLMTADAVGGVWTYAADLARALLPHGIVSTIALLGPAPSATQRAMLADGVALVETGLPLDWLADGPEPVLAAGRAIAALAAGHDVAQLNMPSLGAAASFAVPVVAVAHGCLSTWWEAAHGGSPPADMAWQVALTRAGLHAADAVVAPTHAYATLVQRHYGLAAMPIVIHNGRHAEASVAATAHCDQVFTAGRLWDRVKNVGVLDAVAGRLSIPFHAAGPVRGPHGETATLAHLHALGTIGGEALAQRLRARPVFVSATRFEPFGLAVLEAAQAGCALVLSDIAGFRELWDGAALFADVDDADGYVAAIERIVGDAGLRQTLGQAARARAARYTADAMAAAMAQRIRRLAAAKHRVAA